MTGTDPETGPRPWRQRLNGEVSQLIRYGVVGVLLMIAYLVVAIVLADVAGLSPVLASPLAFVLCLPVAYLGQAILVFRSQWANRAQQKRFVVTTVAGFIIASLVPPGLALVTEVPSYINFLAVSVLVPITNFVVFRLWVFRAT